jgi:hypothetical protein
MSERDHDANRDQGFLGRWIKRKAEVQEQGAAEIAAKDDPAALAPAKDGAQAAPTDTAEQEPAFDLSTLPKLDEITAQTKITDFMRSEVPAALRNAALRQAWAIDPVIRDYVNPAREYAYDWNIPGGVPGNGPIEAGYDALKQVAEAFSRPIDDHTFGLRENTTGEQQGASPLPSAEPELAAPVRMSDIKKSDYSSENEDKNIISDVAHEEPLPIARDVAAPRRRHGGASPV